MPRKAPLIQEKNVAESSSSNLNGSGHIPSAVAEPKKRGFSLIGLVPLIAVLVGGGLAVRTVMERGPLIEVTFKTGDGIEPGKTKVKFQSVNIGTVERVGLGPDLKTVQVGIRLDKSVASLLVEDTRFWVERPRIQGTNVSGLSTLLSGAFIGMEAGKSKKESAHFQGLENAPVITFSEPGTVLTLKAAQLGSVDAGSGLYYRRVLVGQVVRYEMDKEGSGVNIEAFIKAPYDRFLNSETRFWEASGFDVELNSSGFRVETQSFNSILSGGIAFETRGDPKDAAPIGKNPVFRLFEQKALAMALEDTDPTSLRLLFNESVRGLVVGAQVDFRGIPVGQVTRIAGQTDPKAGTVQMVVDIVLYPNRFRNISIQKKKMDTQEGLNFLVGGGLRAQLRTGNLLSGQLFVSLDFFKGVPKAAMDWKTKPPVLPTIPGPMEKFEGQVVDILQSTTELLHKLKALPLSELSQDAQTTIQSLDKTLKSVDRQLSDDSMLQEDLRATLREVGKAAAEANSLLEYLSRHPEALIKGKPTEE